MAMYDLLSNLNGWGLIILTAVVGGLVLLLATSVAAIVVSGFLKIRETDNATRLKQDMLDRGMSAEEIKTVLEAGIRK
jgi:hypothetical protein